MLGTLCRKTWDLSTLCLPVSSLFLFRKKILKPECLFCKGDIHLWTFSDHEKQRQCVILSFLRMGRALQMREEKNHPQWRWITKPPAALLYTLLCCCSDFGQRALPSQSLCSPHRLRMLTGTFLLLLGNTQSWAPTGTNYNHASKNWRQQPSLGSYVRICRISWPIPPTKSQKSRSSDTIALSLLNTGGTTK